MQRRDSARYMAALALMLSFAPSLMRRRRREQLAVSAGSAVLGAAAGWAVESVVVQLSRRLEGGETAARLTVAGVGAAASLSRLDRAGPAVALVGTGARVAGIAALVGWAAPEKRRVSGFDPLPIAAAGALALGVQAVRVTKRRRGREPLPYPCDAYPPAVSYGPDSLVSGLDFEGQRFVAGATTGLASDPVRVFVGLRSAEHVGARCDLAMAELERLGAFEKSRLVVCSATLRGYVNPVPIAAEEVLSNGDVAHVVVQYFDRRTPWLWRKVPIAAQTQRELLERLERRSGPEVCLYGESLGAWASQQAFRRAWPKEPARGLRPQDDASRSQPPVARALWVGTPYLSRFGRQARKDPRVQVVRTHEVLAGDVTDLLRFVLLERMTDPVVLFPGVELLWRRPEGASPPYRRFAVSTPSYGGGSWRPGISFVQGLLDLVKATRWNTEQPVAEGHDYRIELPLVVNLVFGHRRPREDAERIAARVLETEAARAAAVRAARVSARTERRGHTRRR